MKVGRFFGKAASVMLVCTMVIGLEPTSIAPASSYIGIVSAVDSGVQITESKGWHERVYVKWKAVDGAESYNVYVAPVGGSYNKLDKELVRQYTDYYVADALGLKQGSYTIKIALW
jgi:hypothetical protein